MKALKNLLKSRIHSMSRNINGRKSNGREDAECYKHWRALDGQHTPEED